MKGAEPMPLGEHNQALCLVHQLVGCFRKSEHPTTDVCEGKSGRMRMPQHIRRSESIDSNFEALIYVSKTKESQAEQRLDMNLRILSKLVRRLGISFGGIEAQ